MKQPKNRSPAKVKPRPIQIEDQINLDNTFQQIVKILESERMKLSKQLYLNDFVKKLNLT